MVAGFEQARAVGQAGGSPVVPRDDVVEVPDRCVAVGGAAGVVAGLDEAPQACREKPRPRIDADKLPGPGGGEEAPEPNLQVLILPGLVLPKPVARLFVSALAGFDVLVPGEECPGPGGGDDPVARQAGRLGIALEQGPVGHDELHLHPADPGGGAGGPFDEGVGHDLAPGPGLPGGAEGVGVPGQGRVHGHAWATGSRAVR